MTLRMDADPRGPVCRIRRPIVVSSGRMCSNVERSQPAKIEMLPVSARWQPPETGQSTGSPPSATTFSPSRRTLGFVGGRHLHPDLSLARHREQPVFGFQHLGGRGGRGKAGDDRIAGLHHPHGALPPVRAGVQERASGAAIEIAHRQVDPVAQQRARELAADVAEPDEADLHLLGLEWCCEAWRLVATRHRSATEIEHRSCPAADPMPALP